MVCMENSDIVTKQTIMKTTDARQNIVFRQLGYLTLVVVLTFDRLGVLGLQ